MPTTSAAIQRLSDGIGRLVEAVKEDGDRREREYEEIRSRLEEQDKMISMLPAALARELGRTEITARVQREQGAPRDEMLSGVYMKSGRLTFAGIPVKTLWAYGRWLLLPATGAAVHRLVDLIRNHH